MFISLWIDTPRFVYEILHTGETTIYSLLHNGPVIHSWTVTSENPAFYALLYLLFTASNDPHGCVTHFNANGSSQGIWGGISCSLLHRPLVFAKPSEKLTIHYGALKRLFTIDTAGRTREKGQIDGSPQKRFTASLYVHECCLKGGNCRLYRWAKPRGILPLRRICIHC